MSCGTVARAIPEVMVPIQTLTIFFDADNFLSVQKKNNFSRASDPGKNIWQIIFKYYFSFQPTGISEEVFRQIETVQNRYDSSTAEAFRVVQKSGEMVVRTLDPRQFIRLASETAQKINIDTNVSLHF